MTNYEHFNIYKQIANDTYDCNLQDWTESRSSSSAMYDVVCTTGTATDEQAYLAVQNAITKARAADIFGNPLARVRLASTLADGRAWTFKVEYSSKAQTPESFFDYCYIDHLSGGCETSTVTQSLNTRIFPATGGWIAPQNGYINVIDGVAQGVQKLTPTTKFSIRARIVYTSEKLVYARNLSGFQGLVNMAPFWGYPAGTVLFEGFDFNVAGVADNGDFSNAYLDGRFNFQYRPDAPVNIDGAIFTKAGWEVVWALSREIDGAEGHRKRQTVCVYAETVYGRFDFEILNLTNILAG